jgi:carboxypeptidase Taq
MDPSDDAFRQLSEFARDTKKLSSAQALLEWDQQTYMPPAGGDYRAEQLSFLAGLIHERQTHPRVSAWLESLADSSLAADRATATGASIFHWRRQYDKRKRLPRKLVEELAKACALGQMAWIEARRSDDFQKFQPHLSRIVGLKQDEADALGIGESRYDALLDDYEPMARTRDVAAVLTALRRDLVPVTQAILDAPVQNATVPWPAAFPIDQQERLGREAAAAIGFDFSRGRLDTTKHPFCTGLGPHDCRITTRFDAENLSGSFFGILHEVGHGLYEQGLPRDEYGLASGEACSLGIHESQSRLWENLVGRSLGFWRFCYPLAQRAFPQALAHVGLEDFYVAINRVRPSLIRVEADEATYNLHIIIRFELEQALLDNRLTVADLPAAWNQAYEADLGVRPDSDANGVLQDIHWSAGLFGYFPTYSLGNVIACQLFEQANLELGNLSAAFARGEFRPLLHWLRERVHRWGSRFTSAELVQRITQRPIDCGPLIRHLRGKLFPLYGLPAG